MKSWSYLILDFLVILPPFVMSFDKKVAFYKNWKALFPAILITGVVFIIWDILFTKYGVWSFNHEFVCGLYFLGLPVEEWLFFFTVPYACVFILEVLRSYTTIQFSKTIVKGLYFAIGLILIVISVIFYHRLYTLTSFSFCALVIIALLFGIDDERRGWYLIAYLIGLAPFFVVNGVLTSFPIVEYNDQENLGLRLFTIPVEDTIYGMGLLLMNFGIYDFLKNNKTTA